MESTRKKPNEKKVVNFKYSSKRLALLDSVVKRKNIDRTTFITELLDSAIEDALFDRRDFFLSNEDFQALDKILSSPPRDLPQLKALLNKKPLWEK